MNTLARAGRSYRVASASAHAVDGGFGAVPAIQSWQAECVTGYGIIANVSSDNLTAVRPVVLQAGPLSRA